MYLPAPRLRREEPGILLALGFAPDFIENRVVHRGQRVEHMLVANDVVFRDCSSAQSLEFAFNFGQAAFYPSDAAEQFQIAPEMLAAHVEAGVAGHFSFEGASTAVDATRYAPGLGQAALRARPVVGRFART